MRHEPLKDRALGKWPAILAELGVPQKALRNRHGPCPMCGGKDRFRFDDKGGRGTWFCSHCGAGDGIELTKQFLGVDFKTAASRIEDYIGAAPIIAVAGKQVSDDGRKREEMRALWSRAKLIKRDDFAGMYLFARTGLTDYPSCLRYAPDERYVEAGSRATWHPAMIAKVDPSDEAAKRGERAALHRTYLTKVGGKAEVKNPRKMLGAMPTGGAVRLMQHEEILGIAEGIETALAASILFNMPVWAALTAGLLQEWTPPANVTTVFIFGDNDVSNTGQAAAFTLAQRLKVKGLSTVVELPPRIGNDWNDELLAKMEPAR